MIKLESSLLSIVFTVASIAAIGCSDENEPECIPQRAIVTDIDETLTTSDGEWVLQLTSNPGHDPAMRPDANTLINAYADAGYEIFYITARGEEIELPDGRTAREATVDWLEAHGFPYDANNLFLFPGIMGDDDETVEYKADAVAQIEEDGWTVDYAYGNADTDTLAWLQAGLSEDRVFLVGRLAGEMGVQPIYDDDAYTNHLAEFFPTVPAPACSD